MGAMLVDFDPAAPVDRNGLESLTGGECLALLARDSRGRVGVTWDVLPVILPVNYVLDGERVVLRTAAGSKLCAALSHSVVAFEIDGIDPSDRSSWSVLVRGPAHEITDTEELESVTALPLLPWASGPDDRYIAIEIEMVSGRRVPRATDAVPPQEQTVRRPGADGGGPRS